MGNSESGEMKSEQFPWLIDFVKYDFLSTVYTGLLHKYLHYFSKHLQRCSHGLQSGQSLEYLPV